MSMSTTALRFELVLATISRCTAWSWRNSGMMSMNIAVIAGVRSGSCAAMRRGDLPGERGDAVGHKRILPPLVLPA